jgi:hypothetical protein
MIPIEAITGILGTVLPPAFKLVKGIFGRKSNQSPTEALDDIATTKPEILPQYVEALAKVGEMELRYFSRDVTQPLTQWVADLRAAIRPSAVVISFVLLLIDGIAKAGWGTHAFDDGTRAAYTGYIGTWIGDRIS